MKKEILTQSEIRRLPDSLYNSLYINQESFSRVVRWEAVDKRLIEKYLKNAFEPGVKAAAGYNEENRPDKKKEDYIDIDGVTFKVTTTPTTKRLAYQTVIDNFDAYLTSLIEHYDARMLGAGYRTVNDEPYILLGVLVEKIANDLVNCQEGKEGVQQSIAVEKPENLIIQIPEILILVNDRNYKALNGYNAEAYAKGMNLTTYNNSAAKAFKDLIFDDSLQVLGQEPDHISVISYPFEGAVFIHQLEPRVTVSYKDIVDAFFKKAPEKLTKRSSVGDLTVLGMLPGSEEVLKDKGILSQDMLDAYNPQVFDKRVHVRLAGVRSRLEKHRQDNTSKTIEQNIIMLPPAGHA
ncbi:MAG: hypothetical protein NT120_04775 [Candidatus Aenigmarchaeota archaeon]|nr:hypothetical protein [Candidatus Aenigmarchaeota archaeon]